MWPSKNQGEDDRLYRAVKALSDFSVELGINVPTGKDSLSMTQKYPGEEVVYAPGTVIVSAVGEVMDIKKIITPVIKNDPDSVLVYIDLSREERKLGGSSFAQLVNKLGVDTPSVKDPAYFVTVFDTVQQMILDGDILAGHDISAGGMITTLLEMCFTSNEIGMDIDLSSLKENDPVQLLFSENPGIIIQVKNSDHIFSFLKKQKVDFSIIGNPLYKRNFSLKFTEGPNKLVIVSLRIYGLKPLIF